MSVCWPTSTRTRLESGTCQRALLIVNMLPGPVGPISTHIWLYPDILMILSMCLGFVFGFHTRPQADLQTQTTPHATLVMKPLMVYTIHSEKSPGVQS